MLGHLHCILSQAPAIGHAEDKAIALQRIIDIIDTPVSTPDHVPAFSWLQAHAMEHAVDISTMLTRVPRPLLLLLKTNDCLRSVDTCLVSAASWGLVLVPFPEDLGVMTRAPKTCLTYPPCMPCCVHTYTACRSNYSTCSLAFRSHCRHVYKTSGW